MLRWHAKVICGVIMTVAMPICFLLPVKMADVFTRWGPKGQYALDLLTCFAGGVFLSSYLVFMAPAVRVLIEENLMKVHDIEYPLPDMIIGLGFFMMLLLDKFVKVMSTRHKRKQEQEELCDRMGDKQNPDSSDALIVRLDMAKSKENEVNGINHMNQSHIDSVDLEGISVTLSPNHMSRSRYNSECTSDHLQQQQQQQQLRPVMSRQQSVAEVAVDSTRSVTRSVVMMLALSIDSVLEGMTIGLKKTVIEVWAIFIGIIIHESVIAFCLGLQLIRLHSSLKPVALASFVYTIMNPLGLLAATLLYETAEADRRIELLNGLLQGLTAGCFIYIVFYEILEGQIGQDTPLGKILATLIGYLVLSSFAAIPGSSSYTHGQSADSTTTLSHNTTTSGVTDANIN